MRWLIFFLLVLNVLVFAWFTFQDDQKNQLLAKAEQTQFDFSKTSPLVLLGEVPKTELVARDKRLALPEPEEVVESDCALVGPFPELVSAKQALYRLEQSGLKVKVASIDKALPPVHWVYIKPQKTRKHALAILKDLQSKKVDSFLMADGEYTNAISLGVFSNIESAKDIIVEREKQGYMVELAVRERNKTAYWLVLDQENTQGWQDHFLDKLKTENSDVKKQEKSCPDVALLNVIE